MKAVPVILALAAAPALAATPPQLEAAFGNTIVSTYPSGRSAKIWLHPDGTFRGQGAKGARGKGTWKVKDGKLCLKASILPSYCSPLVAAEVGDRWNAVSIKNEPLKNQLVKGRAGERD